MGSHQRAVYSWVFGINFTLSDMVITPCVPKEYENAEVVTPFSGRKITVKYSGYGAKIQSAEIDGKPLSVSADGRSALIEKSRISDDVTITIKLSNK